MNIYKQNRVHSVGFRKFLLGLTIVGLIICLFCCTSDKRTCLSIEGFDKEGNIVVGKDCDVELGSLPENCITISFENGSYRCKIDPQAHPIYYKVNGVNPNKHNIERNLTVVLAEMKATPIPKETIEANLRGIKTTYIRLADYLKEYHEEYDSIIQYNNIQTLLYRNDEDKPWEVILLDDNVSVDGIKYQREKVTDEGYMKLECFYINTYNRTPNNDESFTVDSLSPKVNISAAKTSWGCDFLLIERNGATNTVNFPKPYMSVKKTEDAKDILKGEGYTSLDNYNNEKVVPYNLHLSMVKNDLLLEDSIKAGGITEMLWSKAKLVNKTHIRFFEIGNGTYFTVLLFIPLLLGVIALLTLCLLFDKEIRGKDLGHKVYNLKDTWNNYFLDSTLPLICILFFFLFLLAPTFKSFHDTYSEPYIPVYVETLLAEIAATIAFPLAVALVNPDAVKISSKKKIFIEIIIIAIAAFCWIMAENHYLSYMVLGMYKESHLTIAGWMLAACGAMLLVLLLIKCGFFHWIYGLLKSKFNWIYEPIKDKIIPISNWIGRHPIWKLIILTACLGVVIGAVTRVVEFLSLPVMILLVSWMCKYVKTFNACVLVGFVTFIIAVSTDMGFLINVIPFIIALILVPWVEPNTDLTSTGIEKYKKQQGWTFVISCILGILACIAAVCLIKSHCLEKISPEFITLTKRGESVMNTYKYNSNPDAKTQQEAEWNAAQYAMKPVGKSSDILQNIYSPGVASKKNALRSTAINDLSFLSVGRMLGWAGWAWHCIILGLVLALTWFTFDRINKSKKYNMPNIIPVCTAIVLATSFIVYYLMYWANVLPLTGRPFFGFFALDSPTALISSTIVLAMLAVKDKE